MSNIATKYLIIGNGTAAVGAIEGIRSVDKTGGIVLLAAEPHHTYGRPLISYLLEGKTDRERMKYRPDNFYETGKVDARLGVTATTLDAAKKIVAASDGNTYKYEKLLVATGSSPFVPPTVGYDGVAHRLTFTTLDDAAELERLINPASRVLIIGAGLIGLKCAEGLFGRVGKITVIDLAPRVLSSVLDADASAIIAAHLEKKGIELRLGVSVSKYEGGAAILSDGATVNFDILVTAVGVRANTALIKDAGGAAGRGITVDTRGRTSLPDVYAAGDCTESLDISDGVVKILALLPNAYRQGEAAGINMVGENAEFNDAIPMNAAGFLGLHIITAGSYTGEVYETRGTHGGEPTLKKLFCKDGRLVGYILVGNVEKAGIYTALIRERTPLSEIDFDLIKETPSLMAFSNRYRKERLGK